MNVKYMYGAAVFTVFALGGCSQDKEEAAHLLRAVDLFRAAADEKKTVAVENLRGVACTNADVCAAKDECMQWAEPTANGLKVKVEAKQILDVSKKDAAAAPDVAALPERLDAASKLLDLGHDHLVGCQDKLTGLRIKYGL